MGSLFSVREDNGSGGSRIAHREYTRWRAGQIAYGRWEPWADAGPVRDHVRRLRQGGASYSAIASAAGVSAMTVHHLVNGVGSAGGRSFRIVSGLLRRVGCRLSEPVSAGSGAMPAGRGGGVSGANTVLQCHSGLDSAGAVMLQKAATAMPATISTKSATAT